MPEQPPYSQIDTFIPMMGRRNQPIMRQILKEHRELFQIAPGSRSNHHAWPGGYWDHVTECLNLARVYYETLVALRPLGYSLWEAYEVLFVHDLEKPWKYISYASCPVTVPDLSRKAERADLRLAILEHYGVVFTARQQNALEYCEGESTDYRSDKRLMEPLAHLCHTCDETSARQFPNSPASGRDLWTGARRIASPEQTTLFLNQSR